MRFTVLSEKNPTPYKRTTQRQKFKDEGYKKYIAWKNHVVASYIKVFSKYPHVMLKKNTKYYVNIMIYFCDKTHGDPDNIAKGINDAIFQKPLNDKYIAGSYDFDYNKDNPRVEIEIKDNNE